MREDMKQSRTCKRSGARIIKGAGRAQKIEEMRERVQISIKKRNNPGEKRGKNKRVELS